MGCVRLACRASRRNTTRVGRGTDLHGQTGASVGVQRDSTRSGLTKGNTLGQKAPSKLNVT